MSTSEAWKYLDMQILKNHYKSMCVTGQDFILCYASCKTVSANKIQRLNLQKDEYKKRAKMGPKGQIQEDDLWQHMELFSIAFIYDL